MSDRGPNIYECPNGCKAQGDKPIASTIRGWKKHMTRQHGGYDDTQLAAIVGSVGPSAEKGRSLFLAEANETPGLENNPSIGEKTDEAGVSTQAPEPPKKRVKFKPKAMREFMSGLPEMFFKAKGIETDDADKKLLDAASEMMEELFGLSIEVPETDYVITSRWVAMLFPLLAVFVVWAKHTFSLDMFKKEEIPQDQPKL